MRRASFRKSTSSYLPDLRVMEQASRDFDLTFISGLRLKRMVFRQRMHRDIRRLRGYAQPDFSDFLDVDPSVNGYVVEYPCVWCWERWVEIVYPVNGVGMGVRILLGWSATNRITSAPLRCRALSTSPATALGISFDESHHHHKHRRAYGVVV